MKIMIALNRDGEGEVMNTIINDLLMIPLGYVSLTHIQLEMFGVLYIILNW